MNWAWLLAAYKVIKEVFAFLQWEEARKANPSVPVHISPNLPVSTNVETPVKTETVTAGPDEAKAASSSITLKVKGDGSIINDDGRGGQISKFDMFPNNPVVKPKKKQPKKKSPKKKR